MVNLFKSIKFKQPKTFEFTPANLKEAKKIIKKYPKPASAVMPLLDLAQRQHDNWIPTAAMDYIAELLGMHRTNVYEVANFYSMYNKQPVGEYLVQICRTTPCWLRGSDDLLKACEEKLKVSNGETTNDKKFTVVEVECLGACVNAPVAQINDHYYEDLTPEDMKKIITRIASGETPKTGSQCGRHSSEPKQD